MARIQNNMMAANTHRQYSINNSNAAKAAEKLSSGFRINRAGDDAAGLAISEKMRAQVRGLNMASKNSQDAISLVQTAEGALQEVHSMLQRMNELAVQANTGTNEEFDRMAIAAEFEQLKGEIDDISNQTTFNNMKILDGTMGEASVTVDASSTLKVNDVLNGGPGGGSYAITGNSGMSASKAGSYTITTGTIGADGAFKANGVGDTGTDIQVSFTDAKTGNVTNTAIKADKAFKSADVTNGKLFTLDLSAAGLGKFDIAATGAGASAADFVAQLEGKTVNVSVPAPAGTITKALDGAAVTTTPGTNGSKATYSYDFSGATALTGTETITIGGQTYTFGTDITGATIEDQLASLATKLGTDLAGTHTVSSNGSSLVITANDVGADAAKGTVNTAATSTGGLSAAAPTEVAGVAAEAAVTTGKFLDKASMDDGSRITVGDKTYVFQTGANAPTLGAGEVLVDVSAATSAKDVADAFAAAATGANAPTGVTIASTANGEFTVTAAAGGAAGNVATAITPAANNAGGGGNGSKTGAAVIQVGASQGETLEISINKMDSQSLGIKNLSIAAAGEGAGQAGEAITKIKLAINQVSEQRASLGAMQNRLEHKIANLDTSAENLQAAESRIRDVDIAKEMTNFTKQNILSQAATAMLAQANSAPQNVLQLLR